MHRTAALLATVLLMPTLLAPAEVVPATAGVPAVPAVRAPAVIAVERAYGGPAVRLAPGQGVDVAFRARRGDQVMLQVRSRRGVGTPCYGAQTLVDGLGRRTARIEGVGVDRIMRVRTSGRTYCGSAARAPSSRERTHTR